MLAILKVLKITIKYIDNIFKKGKIVDKKSGGGLYVRPLRKNTSILSIEVFFCMKEFKTIDEQIEILKDRGLIFKDTNMARRYLLTNNYYNIIKC